MRRLLRGRIARVLPRGRNTAGQSGPAQRALERGRTGYRRKRECAEETETKIEMAARDDDCDDDVDDDYGRHSGGHQQLHLS